MLFGLVYTRHAERGARIASPDLFAGWQPDVAFVAHWQFANGGGMGVVEAESSGELEKALAPFTAFFDIVIEQVDADHPGVHDPAEPRERSVELVGAVA